MIARSGRGSALLDMLVIGIAAVAIFALVVSLAHGYFVATALPPLVTP